VGEWKVFPEKKIPFYPVDWGRTKELVSRTPPEGAAKSERVMVKITEYLPGYVHEFHSHPQEEIILVLEGKGFSETKAEKKEIGPGDVVFIPADEVHATHNPGDVPLRAFIIKCPPD